MRGSPAWGPKIELSRRRGGAAETPSPSHNPSPLSWQGWKNVGQDPLAREARFSFCRLLLDAHPQRRPLQRAEPAKVLGARDAEVLLKPNPQPLLNIVRKELLPFPQPFGSQETPPTRQRVTSPTRRTGQGSGRPKALIMVTNTGLLQIGQRTGVHGHNGGSKPHGAACHISI